MESIRAHRGVTVVELLVVLGIIGVLIVVVVTSHTTFNKTILLNYTAYDVALTVRSAQTYGLGTRINSQTQGERNIGYGLHFTSGSGDFTFFADRTDRDTVCHPLEDTGDWNAPDAVEGDCEYDSGENITTYTLGNRMNIAETCAWTGSWSCEYPVTVVFARPDTRAYFASNGSYNESIQKIRLQVTSPQGGQSYVCVARTGEIRVDNQGEC